MTTCKVCDNVFSHRISCPCCGAFIDEMAKFFNRPFRRAQDVVTLSTHETPFTVRYIGSFLTSSGRRSFTYTER